MPNYWLVKTEPGEFSFEDLIRDKKTVWDGVRNHQAKKNMMQMALGDLVLVYHSVTQKALAGLAKVSKTAYPDPNDNPQNNWQVVEIVPVKALTQPVSLADIKATPSLADIALIKQSRLSVMPLSAEAFNTLLAMGQTQIK
ncbi:MAG: EVE domain-containing protein [Vampirovibrionales bacterium]|nr:EVE domain-containing protein [Vampirovibrionales bacterium]